MKIETVVVRINALVFVLYGIAFIVSPEPLSRWATGTVPDMAAGMTDMRATYGGMPLAVGVLLFLLASDPARVRTGMQAVVLIMIGMAAGRLTGMLVDGYGNGVMPIYFAFELGMAVFGTWLLVRRRHPLDAG